MSEDNIIELIDVLTQISISRELFNLYEIGEKVDEVFDEIMQEEPERKYNLKYVYERLNNEISKYLSNKLFRQLFINILYDTYPKYKREEVDELLDDIRKTICNRIRNGINIDYYCEKVNEVIGVIKEDIDNAKSINETEIESFILDNINSKLDEFTFDKPLIYFGLRLTPEEIRKLVLTTTSQRKAISKNLLLQVEPEWPLLFNSEKEFKEYIRTKIVKYSIELSKLYNETVPVTMEDMIEMILKNKRVPLHQLSNSELLELLKKLLENEDIKKSNDVGSIINSIDSVLDEISKRVLDSYERELFTKLLTELLGKINNINVKSYEEQKKTNVLKDLILSNLHNIDLDQEFMYQVSRLSEGFADAIYRGKAEEVGEEDPLKALELISNIKNIENYEELVVEYINRIRELKIAPVMEKIRGKMFIDYKRTTKNIIKYRVPKILKYEMNKSINNIVFAIDFSGSMYTNFTFGKYKKTDINQVKVALLTTYMFSKVIEEYGGEYKIYLFAEKVVDISDITLTDILKLISNPDIINNLIGGGTELAGTLLRLKKYVNPDTLLFLITDTGDSSVTKSLLRSVKDSVRDMLVLTPEKAFDTTSDVFKNTGVEVVEYSDFETMINALNKKFSETLV